MDRRVRDVARDGRRVDLAAAPRRRAGRADGRARDLAVPASRVTASLGHLPRRGRDVRAHADELNRLDGAPATATSASRWGWPRTSVDALLRTPARSRRRRPPRVRNARIARKAPSTAARSSRPRCSQRRPRGGPEADLGRCLAAAQKGIAERGGAQPGEKTMLDALAPAAHASARRDRRRHGGEAAQRQRPRKEPARPPRWSRSTVGLAGSQSARWGTRTQALDSSR